MSTVVLAVLAVLLCGWLVDVFFLRNKRCPLAILPGPPPDSAIAGNLVAASSPEQIQYWRHLDETYGAILKIHALIGMRDQVILSDPEAIHSILVSNVDIWIKPGVVNTFTGLFFRNGILRVTGDAHRRQRKTISPVFSTQQVRDFLPSFYETTRTLCKKIKNDIAASGSDEVALDAVRLSSHTALDIVGNSAIGYNFDTINKDSEYSRAVKDLFPASTGLGPVILFLDFLAKLGPWSLRKWVMGIVLPRLGAFGAGGLSLLNVIDVLEAESVKIFNEKKRQMENEGFDDEGPKDVLTSLLQGSKNKVEDALDEAEIISQIQTLVFAGHETTATVFTRCLQELSQDQKLQDKLRKEIEYAKLAHGDGDLDYDAIQSLPLLEAIVKETLRIYSPALSLPRENTQDTTIPLATPIKTSKGEELKHVFIPKGTFVYVAIDRMNRSKLLFGEDAEEFRPERWLGGGPPIPANVKIPSVYSSILTFSSGARSCIGVKFAVLELKVMIYSLVNNFAISPVYPEKEIKWQASGVVFPLIQGQEDRGPQLPIRLRAL